MKRLALVLMLLVAATVSSALGDSYVGTESLQLTNYPNSPAGITITSPLIVGNLAVGPYQFLIGGTTTENALCVDPNTPISLAPYAKAQVWSLDNSNPGTVSPSSVLGYAGVTDDGDVATFNKYKVNISQLVQDYYSSYFQPAFPHAPVGASLLPNYNTAQEQGLQIAVWAVLLGQTTLSGLDPIGGTIGSLNPTALNYAGIYLTDLANHPSEATFGGSLTALVPITSNDVVAQMQGIYATTTSGGLEVPEPVGLVALAGLAFCGLPFVARAWYRRCLKVA